MIHKSLRLTIVSYHRLFDVERVYERSLSDSTQRIRLSSDLSPLAKIAGCPAQMAQTT